MTINTSMDRIEGEIKRILLTDGPMKPKELSDKIVTHFGTKPECRARYRANMNLKIQKAMISMLLKDEVLLSPNTKLYLPNQKTD